EGAEGGDVRPAREFPGRVLGRLRQSGAHRGPADLRAGCLGRGQRRCAEQVQEPDFRCEAVRLHARSAAGGGADAGLSAGMAGRLQYRRSRGFQQANAWPGGKPVISLAPDRGARSNAHGGGSWLPAFAGMTVRGLLGALVLCLAACTQAPRPVTFHADGYPEQLSDWNVVYRDGDALALNDRVVPFDLNTPLFSDYAHKLRTVWMPEGTSASYEPREALDFPVGTIISKTFF